MVINSKLNNRYQTIVPFILFVLALLLLFFLVRPLISILLGSILLAYLSFPLYKRINMKFSNKSFSIILALFIFVVVVSIPFFFLVFEVIQQGGDFYNSLSNSINKGALFGFSCDSLESKICLILNQAEKFSLERLSIFGFDKQLQKFIPFFEEKITNYLLKLPLLLAEIFLILVISFFILKDWKNMLNKIVELLPMRKKTINRLISEFKEISHTVVYAQLFVALIQGVIATIGFFIFGVPFPLVLGVLTAFCALIPTIGTALIWGPSALILILGGYLSHNYLVLSKGVGLLLYGLLIISTIDNLLLATIVRAKTKVNQIVVIIGVIGGGLLFGFVGIFVGPILLPLLLTYFETFKERFR
jgi:predicted PurR-regulated permease PerM